MTENKGKKSDSKEEIKFSKPGKDAGAEIIKMEAPEPWPDPPPKKEGAKNQDSES